MYTTLLILDGIVAEYLMLIMTALSLAVLFVYRPKKLKALPWIVLALMELTFLVMGLVAYPCALLWGRGLPFMVNFNFSETIWIYFENFGNVGLWGNTAIIVSAIPILALWGILIVGAVQKKKKGS